VALPEATLVYPHHARIKLQTQVEKEHTLRLQLPENTEEGPAEMIVQETAERSRHTLADFLTHLSQHPLSSKEEIDQYLQEARESWER
jgi:hypothetical protein